MLVCIFHFKSQASWWLWGEAQDGRVASGRCRTVAGQCGLLAHHSTFPAKAVVPWPRAVRRTGVDPGVTISRLESLRAEGREEFTQTACYFPVSFQHTLLSKLKISFHMSNCFSKGGKACWWINLPPSSLLSHLDVFGTLWGSNSWLYLPIHFCHFIFFVGLNEMGRTGILSPLTLMAFSFPPVVYAKRLNICAFFWEARPSSET